MKVVINKCFGGFSLSAKGTKRLAELQGRECYFFTHPIKPVYDFNKYISISMEDADKGFTYHAFDISNPNETCSYPDNWAELPKDEKQKYNKAYTQHSMYFRDIERTDPLLIQVVEELGKDADGKCARLSIVEIPDGTEYEISEYDGNEHIAEKHQTWG